MDIYVTYRQGNIPWHWLFVPGGARLRARVACGLDVGEGVPSAWKYEGYHAVYLGCPECRRMLEWSRLNKAITQEDLYRGCVG